MISTKSHPVLKVFPLVFVRVLRLCGMLPCSNSLQRDWKLTMYSVFLLSICLLVKATTIAVLKYSDKVNIDEVVDINRAFIISRFVKIIYPIMKSVIPFAAILNAFWKRKFLHQFCNCLYKSDEMLEREELTLLMSKQMKIATKLVILCLGVSLIAKLCSVLSLVFLKGLTDRHVLLWVVLLYWVDTVGFVAEMQFVLMSICLRSRFVHINNTLQSMFTEQDNRAEARIQNFADKWGASSKHKEGVDRAAFTNTPMIKPVFLLSNKFNKYSNETPINLFEKEFLPLKETHVEVMSLKRLRLRHRYLCGALLQLNLLFEYVLLVSIFSLFLMILLNTYSAIFGLARDLLLTHFLDTCFWLLFYLLRLICPLVVTDSLVDQAGRTVELLSTFATRDLSNASLKEMQEFGREVESRKLTVTCAFNLFTVKTDLLTSAVAVGTTYIVTLIQLH